MANSKFIICGLLTSLVAVSLLGSCTKEMEESVPEKDSSVALCDAVFSASFDSAVKTDISKEGKLYKVNWEAGDKIAVFDNIDSSTPREFTTSQSGANVSFTGQVAEGATEFKAIYPYDANAAISASGISSFIPEVQIARKNGAPAGAIISVASCQTGESFSFKHACSLVSFDVSGSDNLTSLTFGAADDRTLSGHVVISVEDSPVVSGEGSSSVTLLPEEGKKTFETGTYYMAVAPVILDKGSQLAVTKSDSDKAGFKSTTKSNAITRARVYSLGSASDVEWGYYIPTGEQFVRFISIASTLAANETGIITNDLDMSGLSITPAASFQATLEGGGHKIKNLKATEPVFTASSGLINEVCIDSSCHLDVKASGARSFLVGTNTGKVSGCSNAGSISVDVANTTSNCYIGSLVGYSNKALGIENCTNDGNIGGTVVSNGKSFYLGGVCGRTAGESGKYVLSGSTNRGDVSVTVTTPAALVDCAGVCGACNSGGNIKDCVNEGDVNINIVKPSKNAFANIGGIAGYAVLNSDGCTNSGDVILNLTSDTAVEYARPCVGGLFGVDAANCHIWDGANNGAVKLLSDSNVKMTSTTNGGTDGVGRAMYPSVGGIAGTLGNPSSTETSVTTEDTYSAKVVNVSRCYNYGEVYLSNPAGEYNTYIGGIVGYYTGDISDSSNQNLVEVLVGGKQTYEGGLVGFIAGTGPYRFLSCTNVGAVKFDSSNSVKLGGSTKRSYCGGILGTYGKPVVMEDCNNSSKATVISEAACLMNVGGIAGAVNGTLTGCTSQGPITMNNATGSGSYYSELGGIAGYANANITDGKSSGKLTCTTTQPNDIGCVCGAMGGAKTIKSTIVNNTVTSSDGCNIGYALGSTRNEAVAVTLGASDAPLTVTTSVKINGTAAVSSDKTKPERFLGRAISGASVNLTNVVIGSSTWADGFPVKWLGSATNATNWESTHVLKATGWGTGVISVVSPSGNTLAYKKGSNTGLGGYGDSDVCVSGMAEGDYILYEVPAKKISAGDQVDYVVSLEARGNGAPKYWLFEYFNDGKWNTVEDEYNSVKTLEDGTKYSIYLVNSASSYQNSTCMSSFIMKTTLNNDNLRVRMRAVGKTNVGGGILKSDASSFVCLPSGTFVPAQMQVYHASSVPAIKDVRKIGWLGNSFTFYYENPMMVKMIARSQGHQIVGRVHHKGGRTFKQHLDLAQSKFVVNEGGYDVFIIQDQSNQEAVYGDEPDAHESDILIPTRTLTENIRAMSPDATLIIESTWAYRMPPTSNVPDKYLNKEYMGFGGFSQMDTKLYHGCELLKERCPNIDRISPVQAGFAKYRALYPEFYPGGTGNATKSLYYKNDDGLANHHPNINGAYMKACINYLVLYGEPFTGTVDNCGVNATVAAKIRQLAEEVVFGK